LRRGPEHIRAGASTCPGRRPQHGSAHGLRQLLEIASEPFPAAPGREGREKKPFNPQGVTRSSYAINESRSISDYIAVRRRREQWISIRPASIAAPAAFPPVQAIEDAVYGEIIALTGYTLSSATVNPGDVLQVQLQWEGVVAIERNYKVFVQLVDFDLFPPVVAQHDSDPGGGLYPTSTWAVGEPVLDNHAVIVPNDLPPSQYLLITGLYNPDDPTQRLLLPDGSDFYTLGTVTVE